MATSALMLASLIRTKTRTKRRSADALVAIASIATLGLAPRESLAQGGACCLQSGACQQIDGGGENFCCAIWGGVWQGDGTTCATANCAAIPTGACCNSGIQIGGQPPRRATAITPSECPPT